ncbi:hypothetical protein MY11210_008783 [Beauveria gryllotalpidicola]
MCVFLASVGLVALVVHSVLVTSIDRPNHGAHTLTVVRILRLAPRVLDNGAKWYNSSIVYCGAQQSQLAGQSGKKKTFVLMALPRVVSCCNTAATDTLLILARGSFDSTMASVSSPARSTSGDREHASKRLETPRNASSYNSSCAWLHDRHAGSTWGVREGRLAGYTNQLERSQVSHPSLSVVGSRSGEAKALGC